MEYVARAGVVVTLRTPLHLFGGGCFRHAFCYGVSKSCDQTPLPLYVSMRT